MSPSTTCCQVGTREAPDHGSRGADGRLRSRAADGRDLGGLQRDHGEDAGAHGRDRPFAGDVAAVEGVRDETARLHGAEVVLVISK